MNDVPEVFQAQKLTIETEQKTLFVSELHIDFRTLGAVEWNHENIKVAFLSALETLNTR